MDNRDSTFSYTDESVVKPHACIAARVLAHPDPRRVGDLAPLFESEESGTIELSRSAPEWRAASGERTGTLDTGHVSRTPVELHWDGTRLRFEQSSASMPVEVGGVLLRGALELPFNDPASVCIVMLGPHVALWIGWIEVVENAPFVSGLIGESSVMRRLRKEVLRVAQADVPVLLRGETGVGKEIVATAIHVHSRRSAGEYVAVNVAGIPPTMAAAELFGHRRGAFTGAGKDRAGYFMQADHGTLFLDEIGDIASDVQALLLRAIQQGVIQPLGGGTQQVDVRLIAATDSDLEAAIGRREFREPLLRRFAYEIWVPPLRERLDDVGLLFFHLLGEHLHKIGDRARLAPAQGRAVPWVPAKLVARLAQYSWPGNVRELANVALQFAIRNRDEDRGQVSAELEQLLARSSSPSAATPEIRMRPDELSDAQIVQALERAGYSRDRAAEDLGVSRAYLYERAATCEGVVRAPELGAEQVRAALDQSQGDVARAAMLLRVSKRALVLQMKRLEIKR